MAAELRGSICSRLRKGIMGMVLAAPAATKQLIHSLTSYAHQLIGRKHKKLVAGHVAAEGKETLGSKSPNAVTDQHQHRRGLLRS